MSVQIGKNKIGGLDLGFIAAMFAMFLATMIVSFSLPSTAGNVPILIGICGMALCVASVLAKPKAKAKTEVVQSEDQCGTEEPFQMNIFAIVGVILAYFAAMILFGFILSTLAMLIAFPVAMNYKKYKNLVIFSAITTAALYFSFAKFFYVRLPTGVLIDLIFKAV